MKKLHQESMDINEQVKNLVGNGLIVNDVDHAKKILNDISYYRLIKAYSLNLKDSEGRYNDLVTFEHLENLYLFDANFRQMIFPHIEKIEIHLRCRITNYFSDKYGVLGYRDCENFESSEYHDIFMKDIEETISKNYKSPFVKNYKQNYIEGALPFYAVVELFSFGTLSKFYKNMKNEDKKIIAKSFGVGYTYFESWLWSISNVRNICAHYGRLYNAKLIKSPKLYNQYKGLSIQNDSIFSVLLCMKHLLKSDEYTWEIFVETLEELFKKYELVDKKTMGFPENWNDLL